jgi:hypothetical protein
MNASPILASNLSFSLQQFARCIRRVLTVPTLDRIVEDSIILAWRGELRFKYKRRTGAALLRARSVSSSYKEVSTSGRNGFSQHFERRFRLIPINTVPSTRKTLKADKLRGIAAVISSASLMVVTVSYSPPVTRVGH